MTKDWVKDMIREEIRRAIKHNWINEEGIYLEGVNERFWIWRW